MKAKKMLVADLLCGAGGSSTGAQRALRKLGLEMDLVCVNHWPTAIETHTLNHPTARHYVQDIATVRPHLLVPEGYLDLLMASPSCVYHSVARGGKPTSDQQRSDPWHIITWLTELRVKRIIIENVWEFIGWGPIDVRTGKPIKSRKGEYFMAWIDTMKRLGFELEWRKLNAANYGGATTRQRFILKGRSDRKLVGWAPLTHAKRTEGNVLQFTDMKQWRGAEEIIDWDIKGRSIYTRKKPLAPKTLNRIYAGIVKYGWPQGFIVTLRNHMTAQGLDVPLPVIAANGQHIALVQPVIVNMKGRSTASSAADPMVTQTAHASHIGVAEPLVLSTHNSGAARPASDPLPTISTGGAGNEERPGCARPMLVTIAHGNSPGDATADSRRSHDLGDPLGAIYGDGASHALVEPFVLSQASGGAPRSVSEGLPTIPVGGAHSLIVPVTHSQGGNSAKSGQDPLPTITTAKGGEYAVVLPVTHQGVVDRATEVLDPLPTITGANRGELAMAEAGFEFDILFRMLEPHELAAAMGFNDDDQQYEFAGNKTEKIKQIGNAVSVEMMEAEVAAIMVDAAPSVLLTDRREVA